MAEANRTLPPARYDDEIDIRELVRTLWRRKWLIGGTTLGAAAISVLIALVLPNVYRAEALLAPNSAANTSGLSALASSYGNLAGLAGINLNLGANKTDFGLEVLQSRQFVSDFIERHDILVPLMASKGWNVDTGELEIDLDDYDVAANEWVRDVNFPKKQEPSLQEAYKIFMRILSVTRDSESGFVTISIQHYSPHVAKQWVDWLIDDLNSSIMRRDVTKAEQAIAYLEQQIASTSLSDLQNVFFNLIEEQTKTVMLAKVSDEYLLATLDPAVVPEVKHKPKRFFIVILGTMLGGLLGTAIVLATTRRKS